MPMIFRTAHLNEASVANAVTRNCASAYCDVNVSTNCDLDLDDEDRNAEDLHFSHDEDDSDFDAFESGDDPDPDRPYINCCEAAEHADALMASRNTSDDDDWDDSSR